MDKERFDIAKLVVLSGWSLLLFCCVMVIAVAMWQLATTGTIGDTLKGLVQLCFGFMFGSLAVMVKDFISPRPPPAT